MLDIGGRQQQLRQTSYPAGRSYPQQQDEPLSTTTPECHPQGSKRKDAAARAVPASFSDSLSKQPRCLATQPKNSRQQQHPSLFSSEEQRLLEHQLSSLPEEVPVCQCLTTMATNSRSSKISDSSTITTATITTSTTTAAAAALSTLVQNQNVLQLAPNPVAPGQQSDPSFSFLYLAKPSSSTPSSSFPPSSHQTQTQSQILQHQKPCFSMSPQTFPLQQQQQQQQQQQYHFPANAASSLSRQCNTNSVGEANSPGNPNGRSCSSEVTDSASDLGGASRYMMAFITNKLKMQELIDDAFAPANPLGYVHAVKDSQHCNVSISPTTSRQYPSSPQKKTAAITGADTWLSNSGQGSDLQATVQGLLGLRLGERSDQSVAVPPHHLITSSSHDTNRSAYSGMIPATSVALSSTSSPCCSVQAENPASDKVNDPGVISSIGMATCSDTDSFTDISPGTPPDPPKKKHCRSLSIPSGSSGSSSRSRRSTGGTSTDPFRTTDSSRCCTSLWKPIANEARNPSKVQQRLPFKHHSGQGTPPDAQKTSPFSLSTSPLSPNTGMSASLTSLLQPTSSGGLFSSARLSGSVSTNQNGSLSLAAPASTSVSPSQFHVAPSQMPVTMLTSSPPPLASGKPSPQTLFSSCLQSPPDSPVPRPASVSVVGCRRCEDDSDSRAFKPVLDPWLCRSQSRGNSGFSSPSSCSSSSSSFLLVPPQSDPHSTTETQSATIGGLLAAPVPLTQTPHSPPTCTPSSLSSPATVTGRSSSQTPLQPPYWPFQKHRSFSLEEQLSQMGKPASTSPSSFFSPSPPSSSSSVLSSPSHYHHHHHHPYHLPAPVFQTQQYQSSYPHHHHHQQHHLHHHHYQQQQLQQQHQQQPAPQPPQTVSAGGSTPCVPVACKSSVSNPSSPRRQRIPRCRSQPCVLHDRREGRKRRRDYDRPTLDFHKMTQTAYSVFQSDSSGKTCFKQEQWTGLRQQTADHAAGLWFTPLVTTTTTTSTLNTPRITALQPRGGLISLEVLRKTDFLASEHADDDDPLSEDAEISAATEAGEAAARAAAAATTKTTTVATTTTTAAIDSTVPAAMTTTAVAMDDDDDEDDNWECRDLSRPALLGRAINPIGQDMSSVYVSDESNPSFCGCDDDEEEEDDNNDDDNMDSDERVERGSNFQRTNQCMFPITDLDLNQIENH